jgi:hypothetical protein
MNGEDAERRGLPKGLKKAHKGKSRIVDSIFALHGAKASLEVCFLA